MCVTFLLVLYFVLYMRYRRICVKYERLSNSILRKEDTEQVPCNPETENIILDYLELVKEIHELRYLYDKVGTNYIRKVDSVLEKYFPEHDTDAKIKKLCDCLYPGILSQVKKDHPGLTSNDLQLIALMACGFPTGAICAIKRVGENSLNVQKSRTAKKIGPGIRLKDFIADKFKAPKG